MKKNFPKNTSRLLEIIIIFLGIGALILGFLNLKNTIVSSIDNSSSEKKSSSPSSLQEIISQQNQDTDGDGLSDYDEKNVYHTSIYLTDTDSDGISDKEEVMNKKDPNCPEGKDCSVKGSNASVPTEDYSSKDSLFDSLMDTYNKSGEGSYNFSSSSPDVSAEEKRIMSGQATPAEIRSLLKAQGIPEEELNKISDDVIMKTYKEMLSNK